MFFFWSLTDGQWPEWINKAVAEQGFKTPTLIQSISWGVALQVRSAFSRCTTNDVSRPFYSTLPLHSVLFSPSWEGQSSFSPPHQRKLTFYCYQTFFNRIHLDTKRTKAEWNGQAPAPISPPNNQFSLWIFVCSTPVWRIISPLSYLPIFLTRPHFTLYFSDVITNFRILFFCAKFAIGFCLFSFFFDRAVTWSGLLPLVWLVSCAPCSPSVELFRLDFHSIGKLCSMDANTPNFPCLPFRDLGWHPAHYIVLPTGLSEFGFFQVPERHWVSFCRVWWRPWRTLAAHGKVCTSSSSITPSNNCRFLFRLVTSNSKCHKTVRNRGYLPFSKAFNIYFLMRSFLWW